MATAGTGVAAARPGPGHGLLGLPPLSEAGRYNLAPASRSVEPVGAIEATTTDNDYVEAGSSSSEQDAHDLDPGTSGTAQLDGVTVRQAGPNRANGWFSYVLQAPAGKRVTVRVEEAGSESSDYWVLVNGVRVHHRTPDPQQSGTWHDLDGLVHYSFEVPTSAAGTNAPARGEIRLTFENSSQPGPGAQIAGVWTSSGDGHPSAPYGGSVSDVARATSARGMTISSNVFGRPYVIFDFGHEVAGQVQLTLARRSGAPKLGLAFSESMRYLTTASDFSEDPPAVATETHYMSVPAGTTHVTDPVIRGGFRYLMVFLAAPGSVQLSDLGLHFTAAPTAADLRAYGGAFLSESDELNRLWYAGAYTVQIDTIDPSTGRPYPAQPGPVRTDAVIASGTTAVTDGGKRDRLDWVGDQAVEDPVAYLTTGDLVSARNSLEFMAEGAAPDGQVPGIYLPGSGYNYSWAEYAAWWIENYWTHYLYSGDRGFLDRWFATMRADVSWFESHAGADGLLDIPGSAGGHWGYGNSGEETYDNALYAYVLHAAARAAETEGDGALAAQYGAAAQRTADAINANLWDAVAGAYVVAPGNDAHAQDGNAMAVVAGVATGERRSAVLSFLSGQTGPNGPLTIDRPGNVVGQYVSPFVSYFELLAFAGQNSAEGTAAAMDRVHRTWPPMLTGDTSGTFWENVSPAGAPELGSYTSLAHGWSAGVVPFLSNVVLGVTPTAGGFATFDVLPHPPSGLQWAEGAVPSPAGPITAAWRQGSDTFTLAVHGPDDSRYSAGVPDRLGATVSENGHTIWADGHPTAPDVVARDGYIEVTGASGDTTLEASYGS